MFCDMQWLISTADMRRKFSFENRHKEISYLVTYFEGKNRNLIRAIVEDHWNQFVFLTCVILILEHEHYIGRRMVFGYIQMKQKG